MLPSVGIFGFSRFEGFDSIDPLRRLYSRTRVDLKRGHFHEVSDCFRGSGNITERRSVRARARDGCLDERCKMGRTHYDYRLEVCTSQLAVSFRGDGARIGIPRMRYDDGFDLGQMDIRGSREEAIN